MIAHLVTARVPTDGRTLYLSLRRVQSGAFVVVQQHEPNTCDVEVRPTEVTFHECEDHDLVLVPEVRA